MADPRFFDKNKALSLKEIAELAQCELSSDVDGDLIINDVATLDKAGSDAVTFLDNARYKDQLKDTKAGACILHPKMADLAPKCVHLLVSENPYKSYALTAQAFYPVQAEGYISDKAVIGEGVEIGQGTVVEPGAVIGRNVIIGKNCRIGANAVISHAIIGDAVNIYPGVCIGQDGFGFAIDPAGHVKVPQLGRVIIEDHVEVGANTTIDRGAGPDTVIGQGTWIDNLVQIAHNVKIGKGCVIVAQAGIAGSTELEDYVVIAAKTGVAGHLKIGMGAKVGAMSGVMRDVKPGEEVLGQPAIPARQFMRQVAEIKKLAKK